MNIFLHTARYWIFGIALLCIAACNEPATTTENIATESQTATTNTTETANQQLASTAQPEWENINEKVTGEELYVACTFCHGVEAQGNDRRDGPALAGLQAWYIEKQIYNYRNGLRGYSDEDIPGKVMHGSTPMIRDAFTITSISEYIAGLEPGLPMAANAVGARPFIWDSPYAGLDESIVGNAEAGATTYKTLCTACHGTEGIGNEALGAGSLKYLSAIYMERQLMYYRDGIRGAHPDDVFGQQMAAMAKTLTTDQAIADVVAYVLDL